STLTGPTSSAWLSHWRTYLEYQGVRFFLGEVTKITAPVPSPSQKVMTFDEFRGRVIYELAPDQHRYDEALQQAIRDIGEDQARYDEVVEHLIRELHVDRDRYDERISAAERLGHSVIAAERRSPSDKGHRHGRAAVEIQWPQKDAPADYVDAENLYRDGKIHAHYYLSAMDIVGLARTTRSFRAQRAEDSRSQKKRSRDCGVLGDLGKLIM